MDVDESGEDRDEERAGSLHHQYFWRVSPLLQAVQVKRDGT